MAQVLRPVQNHPAASHPDLLIGLARPDDAGVYALGDGRALIQTIDVFTPVVDGGYDWGRIAAANALSDVYAMGGTPLTALAYLGWPRDHLPLDLASQVLRGGFDVLAQGACTVVGGHSIDAPEPTFGFAITGIGPETGVVAIDGARVGDALVLTKPIGTGIVTTAIKRGYCPESVADEAIRWMTTLNDIAGAALHEFDARSATDVTGFGLLGHLLELCRASETGAVIESTAVPLIGGVADLLRQGAWAGGSARNLASLEGVVVSDVDDDVRRILADAQTSGGLLVALDPNSTAGYIAAVPGSVEIGRMVSGSQISIV